MSLGGLSLGSTEGDDMGDVGSKTDIEMGHPDDMKCNGN